MRNSAASRVPRALIALALAAAAVGLCGGAAEARPLITGVTYADMVDPAEAGITQERIAGAGATFTHSWLRWDEVAPASKPASWNPADPADPHYDWTRVDAWVSSAVAAGLTPLLQIYGGPKWAMGCDSSEGFTADPQAPCDPSPRASADFARAAARRYSGTFEGLPRVRHWQYQNEPNTFYFFKPQRNAAGKFVAPRLMRRLTNRVYDAIKSVDPANVVLFAGLMPNANLNQAPGPMDFARRLLCMKGRVNPRPAKGNCHGGVKFDVFDMHPYTSGGPTHRAVGEDNVHLGDLPALAKLLRAADQAGRIKGMYKRTPLWVTEFAWDTSPPDPGGIPMKIHARWTAEALYRSWRAGVSHFFWFSLRDQVKGSHRWSDTLQSGLYFHGNTVAQDKPKLTLRAFRFPFVALRRNGRIKIWGRTPDSAAGLVRLEKKTPRGWRKLASVAARADGIFQRKLRTGYGADRSGAVRAVIGDSTSVPFGMKYVRDFPVSPFG